RLRRLGLGARLFAATGLVVLAGATTLLVVALLVAPPVFHAHLRMALGDLSAATLAHADQAFATAMLLSLAVAVVVAVLAALTVTWLVTRRIATPVADLAAVSHAEERALDLRLSPHPLADLAAAAAAAAQARYAARGVALTVVTAAGTPVVHVDADRFAEAVGNLLDNALRYTPPGGTVTVTTDQTAHLGEDLARLTVTDTGDGFDPADADRLFERLYRADTARSRATGGSGIGLTIA